MPTLTFNPEATRDNRLAIPAEIFDAMKAALSSFVAVKGANTFNRHLADITAEGRSRDPVKRVLFDYFYAIRPGVRRRLGDRDHELFREVNDSHIESAMRRLVQVTE